MQSTHNTQTGYPQLPTLFARPAAILPSGLHSAVIARMLNQIFRKPRAAGELDFLQKRCLRIKVLDVGLEFALSLKQRRLVAGKAVSADASIEGSLYAFLLLAGQQEDPDTLFFHRQLRFTGDTELGLEVKNFLAAHEPEAVYQPAIGIARHASGWMRRWLPG